MARISLILTILLLIPSLGLSQGLNPSEVDIGALEEFSDQMPGLVENPGEAIGLFNKISDLGGKVFSLFSDVWQVIDSWLSENFGISLISILESLARMMIDIVVFMVEIIKRVVELI